MVWLFLELWDTVYLPVTSEYVFVAVPWEWACCQLIWHAEILDNISGKVCCLFLLLCC